MVDIELDIPTAWIVIEALCRGPLVHHKPNPPTVDDECERERDGTVLPLHEDPLLNQAAQMRRSSLCSSFGAKMPEQIRKRLRCAFFMNS